MSGGRDRLCGCGCGQRFAAYGTQRVILGHSDEDCADCERPMLSEYAWVKVSAEQRRGFGRKRGASCDRCIRAKVRNQGSTRGKLRHREEVLEDWELLRSDGVTDLTVAAARMGMTRGALEQALYRARKAGDPRGQVIRNDQLGGASRGRFTGRRAA